MADDHDRIEELLAGYVLRSLSGEDAHYADRLLSEHVPACPMCRDTLTGFQAVAGELALAPAPIAPPDLLLPRIRSGISEVPVPRRRRFTMLAAAAGIAAVVAMAGLTVEQGLRANRAQSRASVLESVLGLLNRPGHRQVTLKGPSGNSPGPVTEVDAPDVQGIALVGRNVPLPAPGNVYRVWLGSAGRFTYVGYFVPEGSVTVIKLTVDPTHYDEILITEEPADTTPTTPSSETRWGATF